jgi:hypothetical protein
MRCCKLPVHNHMCTICMAYKSILIQNRCSIQNSRLRLWQLRTAAALQAAQRPSDDQLDATLYVPLLRKPQHCLL